MRVFAGQLSPATWSEHVHREIQISIASPGAKAELRWHTASGKTRRNQLGPGCFALVPPGQPHTVEWLAPAEVRTLYLAPDSLQEWTGEIRARPIEIREQYGRRDPLLEQLALALIHELTGGKERQVLYCDLLVGTLAAHLGRRYTGMQSGGPRDARTSDLEPVRLRRVLDYMQARLGEPIRLKDLAREAHLSPYHFSRCFKRATGDSPYQRLVRLRVRRAKSLLLDSNLTLAQVSGLVGYGSQSRFSVAFKRLTGFSPGAYRSRTGGQRWSLPVGGISGE